MFVTKQELLPLKEDNLKLKENFKEFWKKHESNKKYIFKEKVKEFMEQQEILIENLYHKIENIIVKDNDRYNNKTGIVAPVPQKRRSEISSLGSENKVFKRLSIEPEIVKNSLENFIINPGLQHMAENIFSNLNYKDITACQLINRSSKLILSNSKFLLKKFIQNGMSKKNQNDWIKAIQLTQNTKFERNIYLYLKRSFRMKKMMDIPCYIDKEVIEKSAKKFKKDAKYQLFQIEQQIRGPITCSNQEHIEKYVPGWIQMLAANDYNIQNYGQRVRMMFEAVLGDYLEIVKTLAPLMENPNAPLGRPNDPGPSSLLAFASRHGRLEVIKFLVPLSENLTSEVIQNLKDHAFVYQNYHVLIFFDQNIGLSDDKVYLFSDQILC